ncbi:MAG TPA: ROK family transcriptional regulator [Candidatus Binatia bacterium]|nr:ROK family transcriptional regulator [Candidatus Binatia bacterium]
MVVEIGQRSETVRRANLSAIVRELHARGPLSRSELVARTGLTRSAIRGLIGELVAADLVSEERAAPLGTPGRPSPLVRPNPEDAVVLALEIAVDTLAVALVGLGGTVLELIRIDRPRDHLTVDQVTGDLAALVDEVRSRRPSAEPLVGAGLAVVGLVRRTDGCVAMAPNLGWIDVPLGERLAAALDMAEPISIANDADLGALAEVRRGAARGADTVIFISGEVGVGGGIVVDGAPLTGVAGYAGEVGHLPVNPNGRPCHCGSVGCWETEIGAFALLRRSGHPEDGGAAAVDAVLTEAAAGERRALDAMTEVGRWVGFGLAGLVNVLDPRLIVLGGLLGRIHPYIAATVDAELDRLALRAPRRLVRVVPATLGIDAPLIGAAELAFERLLADPASWVGPRDLLRASA